MTPYQMLLASSRQSKDFEIAIRQIREEAKEFELREDSLFERHVVVNEVRKLTKGE